MVNTVFEDRSFAEVTEYQFNSLVSSAIAIMYIKVAAITSSQYSIKMRATWGLISLFHVDVKNILEIQLTRLYRDGSTCKVTVFVHYRKEEVTTQSPQRNRSMTVGQSMEDDSQNMVV